MRREILCWLAFAAAVFAALIAMYNQAALEARIRDRDRTIESTRAVADMYARRAAESKLENEFIMMFIRQAKLPLCVMKGKEADAPGWEPFPLLIPPQNLPVTPKD